MPPKQKKPPEACIVTSKATGNRNGACAPCRARKVKCEWIKTEAMCRRCLAAHAITQGAEHKTRSSSLPPSTTPKTDNKPSVTRVVPAASSKPRSQQSQPTVGQKRQRGFSESNVDRQAKQSRTSSTKSREATSVATTRTSFTSHQSSLLDSITEIDDEDRLSINSSNNGASPEIYRTADTMVRVLQGDSDGDDEGVEVVEGYDDGWEESDAEQQQHLRRPRYIKGIKRRGRKKGGQSAVPADVSSPSSDSDENDPKTCDFTIQSVVKGSDGSNIPFVIKSTVTLPDLRYTIASKLRRFPELVQVRYKLESDRSKAATTTIQSDEELGLFLERMRPLIVPQLLPSGKISTRVLKPVIVCFEDGAADKNMRMEISGNNKGNNKNAKKPASNAANATNPALVEDKTDPVVKELVKKWRCDMHSVKDGKDVLCYREPHMKVCYQLTYQNLKYWALLIARDEATIDEKPTRLILDTWDRTRALEQPTQRSHSPLPTDTHSNQSGSHGASHSQWGLGVGPSGYGYPMTTFVVPPWMQMCAQPPATALNMHAGNALMQTAPNPQPTVQLATGVTGVTGATGATGAISKECLEVEKWFELLEQDKERNNENLPFSQYGAKLKMMGFRNITQLSRSFLTLQELQSWLNINAGTAVMILQYAQADMEKYNANTTTRT